MTRVVSNRKQRLAELIKRKIAQIIQQEIRDPRLSFITIASVDVSPDLKNAKVYFTCLEEDKENIAKALNKARAYIRVNLAQSIEARITPELHFIYDASEEAGRRIDQLIKAAEPKK